MTTRCHSLSFAAIRCRQLSLVVILCHSLYQSLSLVVTRCIARLSSYKRSIFFNFLKIYQYSQENTCAKASFVYQVAIVQFCNFIKKRFQHGCFTVNIEKFLKTHILKKICERLLQNNVEPNFSSVYLKRVFL